MRCLVVPGWDSAQQFLGKTVYNVFIISMIFHDEDDGDDDDDYAHDGAGDDADGDDDDGDDDDDD